MKENKMVKTWQRRCALMAAMLLLLPTLLTGCVSADKIAQQRAKTDEISKRAEEYMLKKYRRGFKVKKCVFAEGEQYEGDFFITFTNDLFGYYDSDEDKFYDTRQADAINNDIYNDLWIPIFDKLNTTYDNMGMWSQNFNQIYQYTRGTETYKYSMYHDYYSGSIGYYCEHGDLCVTTESLILINDRIPNCEYYFGKLREFMRAYFQKQEKGDMRVYVVTKELQQRSDFDPAKVDETMDGCLALLHFTATQDLTLHKFVKVTDGLYGMFCGKDGTSFEEGDISLVPVSDSDAVSKKILDNMNAKDMNLIDKYVTKKRSIDFEQPIYQVRMGATGGLDEITLAFVMKDSDEEITEYAPMKEKERSFFAYNLAGDDYNATCLCSQNSRSVKFTYKPGDEVYFWFGTQF